MNIKLSEMNAVTVDHSATHPVLGLNEDITFLKRKIVPKSFMC